MIRSTAQYDQSMNQVAPRLLAGEGITYAILTDVTVSILDVPRWTDDTILRFLEETLKLGKGVVHPAQLTWVRGASFDAHQRKLAHRWLQEKGVGTSPRNALISDSALTRGALTAFAWLTHMETKAFSPSERPEAAAWVTLGLRTTARDVERALDESERLLRGTRSRVG